MNQSAVEAVTYQSTQGMGQDSLSNVTDDLEGHDDDDDEPEDNVNESSGSRTQWSGQAVTSVQTESGGDADVLEIAQHIQYQIITISDLYI